MYFGIPAVKYKLQRQATNLKLMQVELAPPRKGEGINAFVYTNTKSSQSSIRRNIEILQIYWDTVWKFPVL